MPNLPHLPHNLDSLDQQQVAGDTAGHLPDRSRTYQGQRTDNGPTHQGGVIPTEAIRYIEADE